MLYTTEEAAVICGFLNAHLAQAGVEASVRKRNAAFQRGVIMGTLQPDDYRWAENVLCFLKPCWWQLHEDHRALENALLKTHLLAWDLLLFKIKFIIRDKYGFCFIQILSRVV